MERVKVRSVQRTVWPFDYDKNNAHKDDNFNNWAKYIWEETNQKPSSIPALNQIVQRARQLINK